MNDFYPEIENYNDFLLDVDHVHKLYVQECGNPKGQPVLFIHGGPGLGCSANDRRFFDPEKYRIVLFDQRGCGKSLPYASLENNESKFLISDIEQIREKLDIDTWHIFGGSWGSTLALLYAQAFPSRVKSLVLRGIFLAREEDTAWAFNKEGANRIYPDYWDTYLESLPTSCEKSYVKRAYDVLLGEDKDQALKLAKAWSTWEIACCTLLPNKEFLEACTGDESAWTLARHETHYMYNKFFIKENEILENIHKIKDIPTAIIHGRYDVICPFDNAWLLHKNLNNSELFISNSSGHASIEEENRHNLIEASNKMLNL